MKNSKRGVAAAAIAITAIVASHLVGLDGAPPGMHNDEASIGYNAWTIAHYGADQYGNHWPLLFRDFGDYKGPVSTYLLAPLLLVLPLTPAVTRLPSAFAGIALALVTALLAWQLTTSRLLALLMLLEAAFEPWFFHTARINLEADLFTVLCFVAVLAALAGDGVTRLRSCAIAGIALGLAPFAAQPGRFFAVVFAALLLLTHHRTVRWKQRALIALPAVAATAVIFVATPSGAAARLSDVSVFNHEPLLGGLAAWLNNYVQYINPDFLFIHGDPNPRHSSGFGGLLFLTAIPVLVLGIVSCVRRWRDPMRRLALVGFVIAPLGPALTTGISARRDVVVLPFVILLLCFGWHCALPLLRASRVRIAVAAACVTVAAAAYFSDYALAYPDRAAAAFDTGEVPALDAAHRAAGANTIFVSARLQDVAELALFAVLPPPSPSDTLSRLHMTVLTSAAQLDAASPGAVAILSHTEQAPTGFTLIHREALVDVYQRRAD